MEALIIYSLKSALVLALLYLPYTLMLRRERFFRLNRLTLLTILVLSLVQPLWRVSLPEKVTQMPVVGGTQELVWQTEAVIADDIIFVDEAPAWGWQQWLALIYVAGVAAVLCLRLWQLVQIRQTMRRGCLWRDREEGVTVWCHVGTGAPFSWMRSIYINDFTSIDTAYLYEGMLINGICVNDKAHVYQPLEIE